MKSILSFAFLALALSSQVQAAEPASALPSQSACDSARVPQTSIQGVRPWTVTDESWYQHSNRRCARAQSARTMAQTKAQPGAVSAE
jgi:hypothetical protein